MFAPRKAIWCVRRRKSFYPIGTPTSRRGAGSERKAPCWHDKRQLCRRNSPLAGPDAPTPARIGTGRPKGRSHFSFGGERKVCKRKPAARRLREKGFYCPFCRRGSLYRAHPNWQDFTCHRARSELAFFRRQNGRAFFPPLPIAALLPRSWRWADSNGVAWDVSMQLRRFCSAENRLGYISTFDVKHT